ncbi:MAG: thiamine pyrophosphate-dependent enzyme, partial [Candidatus Asgardarchaeia archaeon]
DDPSAHSSQNEQDNRYYALLSGLPMLEPSDPSEAKDMTLSSFDISEKLKEPVILRTTTRVSHSRGIIELGEIRGTNLPQFIKEKKRYIPVPSVARERHKVLIENMKKAREISEKSEFNFVLPGEHEEYGIVTSGVSFNYVLDSLNWLDFKVPVLKVGMTYPLPKKLISKFLHGKEKVLVIEELEPYLETFVKKIAFDEGFDVKISGKDEGLIPRTYELNTDIVASAVSRFFSIKMPLDLKEIYSKKEKFLDPLPKRPPVLCPGCPHRATYIILKKVLGEDAIYTTDIGCYTLGIQKPINVGDLLLCMGSSIGTGCGLSEVFKGKAKVVAIIGDSTFFHSGIPALINAFHKGKDMVVVIMDNQTTAMTGFQPHPGCSPSGKDSKNVVSVEDILSGIGLKNVAVINPFDLKRSIETVKKLSNKKGLSVIVSRAKCAIVLNRERKENGIPKKTYHVNEEACVKCKLCLETGCPAISWNEGPKIDPLLCNGCSLCAQVCPKGAIEVVV